MHVRALDLIARVLDAESFAAWPEPLPEPEAVDADYAEELRAARERTGLDEAIVTGEGRIHGRRVAVVACEFAFLAGSIGVAAAERLVRAIERATAERLPLVASPTSGGTRMQEGTVAFLQMVKISAAVAAHRTAGLPYLVYLRHPTTGGVFASWGSLGHVTAAQPGALIGFLGPRVFEALNGEPFPPGVQIAENLYEHGLIDAVVPPEQLRDVVVRVFGVLGGDDDPGDGKPTADGPGTRGHTAEDPEVPDTPAWEGVRRSRDPARPGLRALLRSGAHDVTPLRGTGEGESEPSLRLALARFGGPGSSGAPCVVLGQDRTRQSEYGPFGPAGLRQARRGMRLAAELGLPLVTVIDTAGAALSREAEEGGLAGEIARCLAELVVLPAPTVCLLLGEGAGGGALALLPADRVLCARHAWLSPLPPEGASAILFRTTERAGEIAERQGIRADELRANGIVDRIIPELPDAAAEPDAFVRRVAATLESEIRALRGMDAEHRLRTRLARYRRLGLPE
ncbi:acetyl-CoA carboxylase carboxyltransferase subunit alpha/beta [Yinghuangia sp. ASG 101]|uniref:acetyl-CoA carboxylase carboxyltransferase subunit alpha/beta n=1 Tax=Yinghuangia sp. ASG 101 TaxID=2896848 RepID=UPI001E447BC5|nr:acetyl-CoA carboxylase carboxyltransferase subunit alpha/beta [Yinghuangia sp. ASG 101]UGQ10709.1 acetyl-CoA carboxylase carboxyltransferase subunit alpha/beta [Yinghuangia sp. ASG 101]